MAKKGLDKGKANKPKFPFARAKAERILKKHCPNSEISPRVKAAFNNWLGEMAANVSKELSEVSHKTITEADFRNAVSKYEFAGDLKAERERITNKMSNLGKRVESFKGQVEKSIIHREAGPQDLIFGRIADQYKQNYEDAVYVSEAAEPEVEVEAEPEVENSSE